MDTTAFPKRSRGSIDVGSPSGGSDDAVAAANKAALEAAQRHERRQLLKRLERELGVDAARRQASNPVAEQGRAMRARSDAS